MITFNDKHEYKSSKVCELTGELAIASYCYEDYKGLFKMVILNRENKIHECSTEEIEDFIELQENAVDLLKKHKKDT